MKFELNDKMLVKTLKSSKDKCHCFNNSHSTQS